MPVETESSVLSRDLLPRAGSLGAPVLVTALLCAAAAGLAAALCGSSTHGAAVALAAAQTIGVGLLFALGYGERRRWASATCVTAVAWGALFLIPSWVYAIDPGQLEFVRHPAPGIAITDISLFALLGGLLAVRPRRPTEPAEPLIVVDRIGLDSRRLTGWAVLGVLSLIAFFAKAGGPVYYLHHLNASATLTAGLFYFVWGTFALKYLVLLLTVREWADGRPISRRLLAAWVAVLVVLGATGNRSFIAIALVEAVIAFSLVRRPVGTRRLAAGTLIGAVVLVFGIGTVKRYENYKTVPGHHQSFGHYVVHTAPGEVVQAYVSNYVDTQELISLARAVVPRYAHYEHGVALLALLVKPIPHSLRPGIHHQPAIQRVFYPLKTSSYAIPLAAIAYMQFGIPGVVVAFLLLGAGLAGLDGVLARGRLSLSGLLTAVAAATMIPFLLRSGVPDGATLALVEVIGILAVARLSRREES